MLLEEASVSDLLTALDQRLSCYCIAYHQPDDNNSVTTRTYVHGNRAAALGLSHLLTAQCEVKMGIRQDLPGTVTDDQDPESASDD